MTAWKKWNIQTWNDRLLAHFFRINDELSSPVIVLLVTAEELARAAGDTVASPDEIRDAFVSAVCNGIGHWASLIEDATDYEGWPASPHWVSPPRFVAHLLFTCVAASESSDELGDEGSFVSRLRLLTQNQLPDHSLQWLPTLWEHLRRWLASNEGRYRPLVLPNPGNFTRIGYTTRLAFPDRRDQLHLSELLGPADLLGSEPPVGKVLSLIASDRGRFKRSFLLAFDEFRLLFDTAARTTTSQLGEHRFWAAVREAALRGRGEVDIANGARFSLLGEEAEDRLELFAVCDRPAEGDGYELVDLHGLYGDWKYVVVQKATGLLETSEVGNIVSRIFEGSLSLAHLSTFVTQGVLPFFTGLHGLLELADRDHLDEATTVLARTSLTSDLLRMFGSTAEVRPSRYEGWTQLHGLKLRTLPSESFDGTAMSRTWLLHEALIPTSIRLRGGIRADDGWLGVCEVLPRVVVAGGSVVFLSSDTERVQLQKVSEDIWTFPMRDLAGEFTLVAPLEGREHFRRIRFYSAPASEHVKLPTDPSSWITEEINGTDSLLSTIPLSSDSVTTDVEGFCERIAYLGNDVGAFVQTSAGSTWQVTHFAGKFVGARGAIRGQLAIPTSRIESANARRRWRKMLFESMPSSSDAGFKDARQNVRARAINCTDLPARDLEQTIPDMSALGFPAPSAKVDRLVRVIVGRASMRAGIEFKEWSDLVRAVLNIDQSLFKFVTRAWMEVGLIDVVSSARWRRRTVFARPAQFVVFKSGEQIGATLLGLSLMSAVDEVRRLSSSFGVHFEERRSVSSLVPSTIALRVANVDSLQRLADACGISVSWLDLWGAIQSRASRHDGTAAPPDHYESAGRWSKWALRDVDEPTLFFEHRVRPDRPDYWIASHNGRRIWSYELNVVRAWGASFLGKPVVVPRPPQMIEANYAFLPLPFARAISILGAGLPGPPDKGNYCYPTGNAALNDLIIAAVSKTFDASKLSAFSAEKQNG
jgi:hypothetical protein